MIIVITSPVGVGVDSGLSRANIPIIDKNMVRSAAQVAENTIDRVEMNLRLSTS